MSDQRFIKMHDASSSSIVNNFDNVRYLLVGHLHAVASNHL